MIGLFQRLPPEFACEGFGTICQYMTIFVALNTSKEYMNIIQGLRIV
jgi:hypothetical protein